MHQTGAWREEIDPQTGSIFYYNDVTFESQWEKPAELAAPAAPASKSATVDRQDLSSQSQHSQKGDNVSFVNLVPTLMRAKRKWRAHVDSNTGNTYYVDEATGVSQWEEPPPEGDRPETAAAGKDSNSTSVLPKDQHNQSEGVLSLMNVMPALLRVKRKWRAFVDNGSGSTYYVDEETGASQWERPSEIDGDGREVGENTAPSVQEEPADGVEEKILTGGRGENEINPRAVPENDDISERLHTSATEVATREVDTVVKPLEVAVKGSADAANWRDGDATSAFDSKPTLDRADSSSTLSTYGGELDSLAKYVTGHSSTLDREAIVELDVPKERREGGGESTTKTDEDSLQLAVQGPSDNSNRSISDSGIEVDEPESEQSASTRQSSTMPSTGPSPGADAETLSQDGSLRDATADGDSSSNPHNTSSQQATDTFDGGNQNIKASTSPITRETDEQAAVSERTRSDPSETRSEGDMNSPFLTKPDNPKKGEGVALSPEGSDEAASREHQTSTSPPAPTSEVTGVVQPASKDAPSVPSSITPDATPHQHQPSTIFGVSNGAFQIANQTIGGVDEPPLQHGSPTATITAKQPSGFDTAAVAAVALQRLKAGMLLKRQRDAVVKLQAQARGWAARRQFAKLVQRRETRQREEHEVQQRAATAIQAVARGRAGRKEAHKARQMRSVIDAQKQRDESSETSRIRDGSRSGNTPDTSAGDDVGNLGGGRYMPAALRSLSTEQQHDTAASETVAFYDMTVQEQHQGIRRDKEGNPEGLEQHGQSAGIEPSRWSEEENPPTEDALRSSSGEHEQYLGQEQARLSLGFDGYGGEGGRFEPGPLGTIDEEGHQRNEHLWGGGEADRLEQNTSASSEDGETLLVRDNGGAGGPSGWSGPGGTTVGAASISSDSGYSSREGSTDEGEEDAVHSDEGRYDSTSRTTLSSGSSTRGWERGTSEVAASTGESRSGSLPEDEYCNPSSRQNSGETEKWERGVQHRQQHEEEDGEEEKEEEKKEEEEEEEWEEEEEQQQKQDEHTTNPAQKIEEEAHLVVPRRDGAGGEVDIRPDDNTSPIGGDGGDYETVPDREKLRGLSRDAMEQIVGKGVYLDSTAPVDRLEDMRGLVAEQAQVAARVTMTAAGTDASKREAARIRYRRPTD